ncbi:hypothetical protein TNCV_1344591 [Trichonephila clavipes]|nr:hypothetical protein TNCV_1344591 [Trichonephila clavipes]
MRRDEGRVLDPPLVFKKRFFFRIREGKKPCPGSRGLEESAKEGYLVRDWSEKKISHLNNMALEPKQLPIPVLGFGAPMSYSIGAWEQQAGTSDPHSVTSSCSTSEGNKSPCHIHTDGVSLSRPADITLHSICLKPRCARGTQAIEAVP